MHYRYVPGAEAVDFTKDIPWQALCRSKMCFKICFLSGILFVSATLLIFTAYISVDDEPLFATYELPFYLDGWRTQEVCSGSANATSLDVLFFVHTAAPHSGHRHFYRNSLLRNPAIRDKFRFGLVFFVGQTTNATTQLAVEEEAKKYGDVVVFPFLDTYRNLTYKFVYGLKWVNEHCKNSAKFIVKMDDDALVNVFVLEDYLRINMTDDNANDRIHCLFWRRTRAVRNKKSKWFVTRREYPSTMYPTYCGGLGFILPSKILPRLLAASRRAPFLWVDDIYSTGILARAAKIGHVQISQLYELYPNETAAVVRPDVMFTHLGTPALRRQRYRLWDEILQFNNVTSQTRTAPER